MTYLYQTDRHGGSQVWMYVFTLGDVRISWHLSELTIDCWLTTPGASLFRPSEANETDCERD